METITITLGNRKSEILVGETLQNVSKYVPVNKTVIVTDETVYGYYGHLFPDFDTIIIGTSEKIKTLETATRIYRELIEKEMDRSSFLLGIGGGVVCDITGFVASTYLRGVRFGFVSTTLLSQVDASIGGKNGVNLDGYKNMIGVFNQPEFVICDFALLKTLSANDFQTGFAEIIKHACIANKNMFHFIETNFRQAKANHYDIIYQLVYDSLQIKGAIVGQDEHEITGERRKLNFGHTYGHAIEKISGMPHGHAISIGMMIACHISVHKGLLSKEEANRIEGMLHNFDLPTKTNIPRNKIFDVLKKDKKREGNDIHFVLLHGIGNAVVQSVSLHELETVTYE